MYKGLLKMIIEFNPDVILHHGVPSHALLTLKKYKQKHNSSVKIYLDSHEDFHNSHGLRGRAVSQGNDSCFAEATMLPLQYPRWHLGLCILLDLVYCLLMKNEFIEKFNDMVDGSFT